MGNPKLCFTVCCTSSCEQVKTVRGGALKTDGLSPVFPEGVLNCKIDTDDLELLTFWSKWKLSDSE